MLSSKVKAFETIPKVDPDVLKELLSYDPETGELKWRLRYDSLGRPNTRYAGTIAGTKAKGMVQIRITNQGKFKNYAAHHIAWAIVTGKWPEMIDHVNGDPYDNRLSNLRLADSSENNCNRHTVVGACGYRGVYFCRKMGKYAAQIKRHKQWRWLGLHLTAEDAAKAYDEAAIQLHGEYAVTNKSLGLLDA